MKVKIGPYLNWIGPYQIADAIFFWQEKYSDTCPWAKRAEALGNWLATDKNGNDSWFANLCSWIHSKKQRKINIRIDNYDIWSMDSTLSLIIAPMLIKLKEVKHGYGLIDDIDVPKHLRSINAPNKDDDSWDSLAEARYNWFLDELIWAFTVNNDDNETDAFYDHGTKIEGESFEDSIRRIKVDYDGLKAHEARKQHAFVMFGKYFQTLWD